MPKAAQQRRKPAAAVAAAASPVAHASRCRLTGPVLHRPKPLSEVSICPQPPAPAAGYRRAYCQGEPCPEFFTAAVRNHGGGGGTQSRHATWTVARTAVSPALSPAAVPPAPAPLSAESIRPSESARPALARRCDPQADETCTRRERRWATMGTWLEKYRRDRKHYQQRLPARP